MGSRSLSFAGSIRSSRPSIIFDLWQKQLFGNGDKAFERKGKPQRTKAAEQRRIALLESKITHKNKVVAELLEEHVKLKKELGEL